MLNSDFLLASDGDDSDSVNAQASDTEADPGVVLDDAGSMDDESTQPMDDLNGDSQDSEDDDYMVWETAIDIKPAFVKHGESRIRSVEPPLRWKGAEWNILAVFKQPTKQLSLFFGYDGGQEMRPDWSVPVTFVIRLLGENNKVIHSTPVTSKNFMYTPNDERIDCGNWDVFSGLHIQEALKRSTVLRVRVEVSEDFVPARVPLNYDSKAETGMVGLENLGATCYLNALLQMLYHINSFRKAVYKLPHVDEVFKASTTLALQSVFKDLQSSRREVTTKDLTVAFGWTTAESFMQQDVQEMMRILIDKLEEKMANTVVDGFIKGLMAGTVRSFIKCVNVDYESKREEAFYDIQLDVKGCKDIYESFRRYTTSEMLDGENQYDANVHGKQDAKKGVIFTKFPPVLTIHLKRFDFDMQTMGFNKIHDHFAFPQQLKLDDFLAADCPEESREVKNTYQLHSVLVHAGDVGGGHYYAYIRPSTNYDYSQPPGSKNTVHKDKQWFKFNDEIVMQVKAREAIEHCYGRKVTDLHAFKGGMSSAYMLVYIRESEMAEIMTEVSEADIPQDLLQRIEVEMKERNDLAKAEMRNKLFSTIYYVTEDDVRNFSAYTKFQDFLPHNNSRRSVNVMNGSTKLSVLMRIADELNLPPALIRLWSVEKPAKGFGFRLVADISIAELNDRIAKGVDVGESFYVQVLNHKISENGMKHFQRLHEEESHWLDIAREHICKSAFFGDISDIDPVDGCGIGSSNQLLKLVLKDDVPAFEDMIRDLHTLNNHTMELMKKYGRDIEPDDILVFVKAFDPLDALKPSQATQARLSAYHKALAEASGEESPKSDEELFRDAAMMEFDSVASAAGVGPSIGGGGGGEAAKTTVGDDNTLGSIMSQKLSLANNNAINEKLPEEYMPMKYLGVTTVKKHTLIYSDLGGAIRNMVVDYGGEATVHPAWLNASQYRLCYFKSPTMSVLIPRALDNGQEPVMDLLLKNQAMYLITVDIPSLLAATERDHHAASAHLLPYKDIATPHDWLAYRGARREFSFKPLSARDAIIVTNVWESEHRGSAKSGGSPGEGSTTSASVSDLSSTTTVEGQAHAQHQHQSQQHSHHAGPCISFKKYVPLTLMLSSMIDELSAKIGIPKEHIILYVTQKTYSPEMEEAASSEVNPCHVGDKDQRLDEIITVNNKLMDKSYSAYVVLYQISPFSVVDGRGLPAFATSKCFEFHVNDARLRRWRHAYLRHYQQIPLNTSASQHGGLTVESGETTAVESDAAVVSGGTYDLKRRRLSPLNSDYQDSIEPTAVTMNKAEWPEASFSKYDIPEDDKVRISVMNKKTQFTALAHLIRRKLGVPKNIDALVAPTTGMSARDAEAWNQIVSTPSLLTDAAFLKLTEACGAVTSEVVKRTPTGEFTPTYPLAFTGIRANVVNEVMFGQCDFTDVITSWMDASIPRSHLFQTGVQHVSLLDCIFMQSRHPKIKSMIVSVFSFTLLGNVVQPCDMEHFGGPFVTYLREDDDYDSFSARVRAISGDSDEDWEKCRLAVVKRKIPHFIKRPAVVPQVSPRAGGGSAAIEGTTTAEETTPATTAVVTAPTNVAVAEGGLSLWDSFALKYEAFAKQGSLAEIVKADRHSKDCHHWSYPQLGIQRPVSDVYSNRKRSTPKAIKIT